MLLPSPPSPPRRSLPKSWIFVEQQSLYQVKFNSTYIYLGDRRNIITVVMRTYGRTRHLGCIARVSKNANFLLVGEVWLAK